MRSSLKSLSRMFFIGFSGVLLLGAFIAPEVVVPKVKGKVKVDGVLDEPLWKECVKLTGFKEWLLTGGDPPGCENRGSAGI